MEFLVIVLIDLFASIAMSHSDNCIQECNAKAIEACTTAQAMIDINAKHLDGLRTECAITSELTQIEIRAYEVSFTFNFTNFYQIIILHSFFNRANWSNCSVGKL